MPWPLQLLSQVAEVSVNCIVAPLACKREMNNPVYDFVADAKLADIDSAKPRVPCQMPAIMGERLTGQVEYSPCQLFELLRLQLPQKFPGSAGEVNHCRPPRHGS